MQVQADTELFLFGDSVINVLCSTQNGPNLKSSTIYQNPSRDVSRSQAQETLSPSNLVEGSVICAWQQPGLSIHIYGLIVPVIWEDPEFLDLFKGKQQRPAETR